MAEAAILVITRAADHDVDRLSLELGQAGVPMYRVDTDRCAYLQLAIDIDRREICFQGHLIAPRVVWLRHLDPYSLQGPPPFTSYVQQQYPALLNYLSRFPGATQVNPSSAYGQLGRLEQLSVAAGVGMPVPRTCVASTINDACRLLGLAQHDIIAKPAGQHFVEDPPSHVTGVFPRSAEHAGPHIEPVPVIYQQQLPVDEEWRLYWIDGQVIPYRVERDGAAALWTSPDSITVTAEPTAPTGLQAAISAFCAETGIRYGAFDFLDVDGNMVFLEVNLDGDWAWFEHKAGDDRVSQAARTMLTDMLGVPS